MGGSNPISQAIDYVTDDVLGFDPGGGGIYSATRDVLGDTIADDVLGFDPGGGGIVPVTNTAAKVVTAYLIGDAVGSALSGTSAGTAGATGASEIGATSTAAPGSFAATLPELGVTQTAGATAVPGSFAAETAGLLSAGAAAPLTSATEAAASNIDPAVLETMSQEQVNQAAINSPYYAAAQSNIDPALLESMSAAEVANAPVLTSTVLPETLAVAPSMGFKKALDAARAANSLKNLLGQPTAQIPQFGQRNIQPQGSVQYPSLSLLEMRPIQRPTTLV